MLMSSTSETNRNCPPPPSAPQSISSFSYSTLILLFFSDYTPLHYSAGNRRLEVCRLLLQCNADVGTEVELLLVGVPGNCYPGSRLSFDDRLLVPPDTTGVSSSHYSLVRLHCSSTFTSSSSAGDEGHPSGCSRTCEVVVILSVSRSFHPPQSFNCFKNFPLHGQFQTAPLHPDLVI